MNTNNSEQNFTDFQFTLLSQNVFFSDLTFLGNMNEKKPVDDVVLFEDIYEADKLLRKKLEEMHSTN